MLPEPGNPVTLFLTDNSTVSCSIENIYNGSVSCPIGWQGKADDGLCFKVRTEKVTNEEACRKVFANFVLSFLNRLKIVHQLLHILTSVSVWVLCTQTLVESFIFSIFSTKKLLKMQKSNKFGAKFSKKFGFSSLHQNPGRMFYSPKMSFLI